jgi:hypothetical protein
LRAYFDKGYRVNKTENPRRVSGEKRGVFGALGMRPRPRFSRKIKAPV